MTARSRNKAVTATLILGTLTTATVATAGERKPDFDAIAERLVNQCAAIHEGDLVWISGSTTNQELLEDIAIRVRRRGAFPLLSITTDVLERRLFDEVPARYDTQKPELALKLAQLIDAVITVTPEEGESIPPVGPPRCVSPTSSLAQTSHGGPQAGMCLAVTLLRPRAIAACRVMRAGGFGGRMPLPADPGV